MILFAERARVEIKHGWKRRIWLGRNAPYRVVHHRCLMGRRPGKKNTTYPDYYSAEYRDATGWNLISKHKTRPRAEEACGRHFEIKGELT